jgi:O-antigen ligase
MAETGIIGFLIYFLTYGATLYGILKVRRRSRQLLPASSQALYVQFLGVLAFYVAGIFGSVAHVSFLILQVTVVWAFSRIVEDELAQSAAPPRPVETDYAQLFPPSAGVR